MSCIEELTVAAKGEAILPQVVPSHRDIAHFHDYTSHIDRIQEEYTRYVSVAGDYIKAIRERLLKKGMTGCGEVVEGSSGEKIIDCPTGKGVDLITLFARGRSGNERWLLCSVADKVLYAGDGPALLARTLAKS